MIVVQVIVGAVGAACFGLLAVGGVDVIRDWVSERRVRH